MSVKRRGYHLEGLMALLLFGVFAVCLLIVLLTGADSYQRLTRRDRASDNRRVCVQYLTTRVRQADAAGGVSAGEFGGGDALLLTQDIGGPSWWRDAVRHPDLCQRRLSDGAVQRGGQ